MTDPTPSRTLADVVDGHTVGSPTWSHLAASFAATPDGELDLAATAAGIELTSAPHEAAPYWRALEIGRLIRDGNLTYSRAIELYEIVTAHQAARNAAQARSTRLTGVRQPTATSPDLWHRRKMVAIDLESTGLDVETDRALTIAVLEVYGDPSEPNNVVQHTWTINPGVSVPDGATHVHGLTTETIAAHGLPPYLALKEVFALLRANVAQDVPIVAFNGGYDLTMLDREGRRHGLTARERLEPAGTLLIDPLVIDRALFPNESGSRTLTRVASRYGLRPFTAHDAASDALAAARIAHQQASRDARLQVHPRRLLSWQQSWNERYLANRGAPAAARYVGIKPIEEPVAV